jgi:hypothetical protein
MSTVRYWEDLLRSEGLSMSAGARCMAQLDRSDDQPDWSVGSPFGVSRRHHDSMPGRGSSPRAHSLVVRNQTASEIARQWTQPDRTPTVDQPTGHHTDLPNGDSFSFLSEGALRLLDRPIVIARLELAKCLTEGSEVFTDAQGRKFARREDRQDVIARKRANEQTKRKAERALVRSEVERMGDAWKALSTTEQVEWCFARDLPAGSSWSAVKACITGAVRQTVGVAR